MTVSIEEYIAEVTGASQVTRGAVLQQLWSGYGEIVRYTLQGCDVSSVIVKQIAVPEERAHPRGWHTDLGHQRKLRSYAVESEWYRNYAARCGSGSRVAHCYGVQGDGVVSAIVLEDLDAAGFDQRLASLDDAALIASIDWLANFHAQWLGESPAELWERGSYWHLDTRPDELAAMPDGELKQHASAIDARLENAQFKTLLHGDAKAANFCYRADHQAVAAVDFQYVGSGVGVVDLAYFLGSCLSGEQLERDGESLLGHYLMAVSRAAIAQGKLDKMQVAELIGEWRELYPFAWADFERFLQGWSPGHPKLNSYSADQTVLALKQL